MTSQPPASAALFAPIATLELGIVRQNLLDLFCQVAYKQGDFVLSSGQRSSYYINGKPDAASVGWAGCWPGATVAFA